MAKQRRSMQKTVEELVERHGLQEHFADPKFCVKIASDCPAFEPLSIQRTAEGHISVAHYIEEGGDLVADPEIVFHRDNWYGVECSIRPAFYERVPPGRYSPGLEELARVFAQNIRHQGFYAGEVVGLSTSAGQIVPPGDEAG